MSLKSILNDFISQTNSNDQVRSMLEDWNPVINIIAQDTGISFQVDIQDQALSLKNGDVDKDQTIDVMAEEEVLRKIFSGKTNPSTEVLDGTLTVLGLEKDQIKLDGITFIIWG